MRIGFDVSQTGAGKAGCGFWADSLVRHLAEIDQDNEYVLYPTFGDGFWDPDAARGTRWIDQANFHRGLTHESAAAAREFWQRPPGDLEERLGAPDVIHANNYFSPRGLRSCRLVYTLHDLAFLAHPQWTTERNRQLCFRGVFDASLYADLVLAVSECSRRDFLETFPHYPAERTRVVHEASRFEDATPVERPARLSWLETDGFLLCVGTVEPRKNLELLMRAYAGHRRAVGEPLPLVHAGGAGWLMDDLERVIADLGLSEHVHLLGYVADRELQWLYQSCGAFVFPSLYEGFGLPVVEAMSQGAAVITSSTSSLPEVAGDAALLVDPRDQEELEGAITSLCNGARDSAELRRRALAAAARFSWRRTAEQVLECYREAVEGDKYSPPASTRTAP